MNEKVVQSLQRIVENPEWITESVMDGHEIFFRYKGNAMSVVDRRGDVDPHGRYSVYFYPNYPLTTADIANAFQFGTGDEIPMVPYHSRDFEDDTPFRELYATVLGKHHKIDSVLDSILS